MVVKDLITGDYHFKELTVTQRKLALVNQKLVLKDSIIFSYKSKVQNFNSILILKNEKFDRATKRIERLELDLQKQKLKNSLITGGAVILIITALVL